MQAGLCDDPNFSPVVPIAAEMDIIDINDLCCSARGRSSRHFGGLTVHRGKIGSRASPVAICSVVPLAHNVNKYDQSQPHGEQSLTSQHPR